MDSKIGKMLVDANLVTEQQLQEALALQREAGGRLGDNLIKLNYMRHGAFEQFVETAPNPPHSIAETGVGEEFLVDLAMKHLYYGGVLAGYELANRMKLPFQAVVQPILRFLKDEKLCEIKKGAGISEGVYTYALTDEGRRRAREVQEQSAYAGPAPVPIEAYLSICGKQTVRNLVVRRSEIDAAFTHLVIPAPIMEQLGPAVNSGKSIFLFGDPGNGKTSIAESLAELMHGGIYIPYAVTIGNQIVKIFDPVHHIAIDIPRPRMPSGDVDITQGGMSYDQRWVFCRRPVVEVGGELTLDMLDLRFDRHREVLRGAAPGEGQRRHVPHRRLRPPAGAPARPAEPLDRPAREAHRLPDAAHRQEDRRCRSTSCSSSRPTSTRRTWSTRRSCAASATRSTWTTRPSRSTSRSSSGSASPRACPSSHDGRGLPAARVLPAPPPAAARLPPARPGGARDRPRALQRGAAHAHAAGARPHLPDLLY